MIQWLTQTQQIESAETIFLKWYKLWCWRTYICHVWYPTSRKPWPARSTRVELVKQGQLHDQLSATGILLYPHPKNNEHAIVNN